MAITASNTSITTVDIQKDIIDARAQTSFGTWPLVNIKKLDSTQNVLIPVNEEDLTNTKGEFINELETSTAKNTVLNGATLTPKRLTATIEVSNELIMNSAFDLESHLKQRLTERIMYTIDRQLVVEGTQTGTEAKKLQKYAYLSNAPTTTAYGAALSYEDMIMNYATFKANPSFMKNAFWVISPDCKLSVLDSKGFEKLNFVNVPTGAEATLLGLPVFYTNLGGSYLASDLVTAKTTAYAIGNPDAYTVAMTDIKIIRVQGDGKSSLGGFTTYQAVAWVDGKVTNKYARQAYRVI